MCYEAQFGFVAIGLTVPFWPIGIVGTSVATLRALAFFDHCYIGGGNARKIHGSLGDDVSIVDNSAGILGGIKLWDESHLGV